MGIQIDVPSRDARPDKFLTIFGREPFGRGIEKFHQLHPHLEIGAAVPTRCDTDADIVVELATHEALRDLEQATDDDALEHYPILATDAPRDHPRPRRIEAKRQELVPDLRMGAPLALGFPIPLSFGTGRKVIPVQFEELGHRRIDVHAAWGRRTPTTRNQVSDIDFGHLNRIRQLARGALELAQPAPD
ncbi:MAG TPA: hypothetical protein VKQ05_11275 [Gemmatimonadales bacterium]|nr:hypothetical protein [Gemmatimonadales bacterium]